MKFNDASCSSIIIFYWISQTFCAGNENEKGVSNEKCMIKGQEDLKFNATQNL